MSQDHPDDDQTPDQDPVALPDEDVASEAEEQEEEEQPLDLTVEVDSPSACERHVTVTVSADDVARYRDNAISELMPTAAVPGFRPGRAPRKLVEHRFHKDVDEQVKGSLLMASMTQVSEDERFAAISEPEFDLDAVEIPAEGPMAFEFDIEVRPEFDLPEWKGLLVQRPVREFGDSDIDRRLREILAPLGELVPCDGPVKANDHITTNITVTHDGNEVASARDKTLRVAEVLSFRDGRVDGFAALLAGATPGERRQAEMELTSDAANEELRSAKVDVQFEVLDVKQVRMPELTSAFLAEMGDFDSEEELRVAVRKDLERKLAYHQAQQVRRQITAALTAAAKWELPPGLLQRQSARELERSMMELRRSGFSETEVRTRENELRQNSAAVTARSLKEHFILERIAEEEQIDASNDDFDAEIALLAVQSGDSPRRVRAQIEKRGMMDVLRNQIVERKVIDLVRANARFQDQPFEQDEADVEAIEMAAGGDRESPIPEATQGSEES